MPACVCMMDHIPNLLFGKYFRSIYITFISISAIWNAIEENHLTEKCFVMKSREATLQELITVHRDQYVQDFFSLKGQFNPQENNKKISEVEINFINF
jgi:acetoin utilization deacetylase AcuC-like enzyme